MNSPKTAAETKVGDRVVLSRIVSESDLALFAAATGDANPIHFDQVYAEGTFFKGRIAHGILSAGFVSAVLANRLPGLGTVYVSQNLKFLAPVRIGDTVTVEIEVTDVDTEKNRVRLRTKCINQDGTVVLDGEAVVMPPKRRLAPEEHSRIIQKATSVRETLASARAAFLAALDKQDSGPDALPAVLVHAWTDQASKWTEIVEHYCQAQTKEIVRFWNEQSLVAQRRSSKFMAAWAALVDECHGEARSAWRSARS